MPRKLFLRQLTLVALAATAAPVSAQPPLHERVDRLIEAGFARFSVQPAAPAGDAEFLRRVYLDLAGTVPTPAEARAFLNDPAPDKRTRLIDRLLASPDHARHLRDVFDVMLLDRRRPKYVPQATWQEYLRTSFAANKPWDQLAREILAADGADPKLRPAARFYLDREGEPNLVARDVGRLFLGMNLQCAQCHDHPLVKTYLQEHYQGIYAFLNRSFLFTDKKQQAVLAERAEGEVSFQSVFDPTKTTKTTGPRLPGRPAVKEPAMAKGKEYAVAPAKGVRPVPRYSRRSQLAVEMTSRDNERFRRNGANRLWAMLLGRGLVHPLDMDHADNPPAHPELLQLLADEFAARNFDMRSLLRELALTRTYQRSSELPAGVSEAVPPSFAAALLKPLSPEQLARATMRAAGEPDGEAEGNVAAFVRTFGGKPGQPDGTAFEATLDQALFLRNGALIRGWLAPRSGNLVDRLQRLQDPKAVAEELYVSVLTRSPTREEAAEVAGYLKDRPQDRTAALQELAWALLASAEFRFNH